MVPVILVPQGAEYQAVSQGASDAIQVVAIPAGIAVADFLDRTLIPDHAALLVMGLCGSLSSQVGIGELALYHSCVNFSGEEIACDRSFTQRLQNHFRVASMRGFISDRVICSVAEKRALGEKYQADVVDMEGFAIAQRYSVAMLRVVSDDLQFDLPDLSDAIVDGKIQGMRMAKAMVKKPIAASRLIQGSLAALKRLRQIAAEIETFGC
ncbi:hypothetical protein Q2T42_00435 [Leptolyngbya boryana CZ1]|uniref:Nucleoside phosphorylase domain-containing protein n=1 Tax=Leptolyngbya boryana CZ1 TaxID=3060204 RepID=A0AA96WY52_LEPBY|nr:hypothetical protein [Leptolyngbya boryana]WNZ46304.1 hypothetical protein Q2T42_00435 [Leptolyngbya boryana CZ1]